MFRMMKMLDLFSGIGGFSLAASWTGCIETVAFCEIDPFCQKVLKKHWPDVPIISDIREVTVERIQGIIADTGSARRSGNVTNEIDRFYRHNWGNTTKILQGNNQIDILVGGFPCQPFSLAGKRKGTADDRHLWPEMLRIISEVKPTWVIAENVYGLLSQQEGVVFENCCLDLENQGYEVQPFIIPACAINAPHRRDRVWIVAYRKDASDTISYGQSTTKSTSRNIECVMGEAFSKDKRRKKKTNEKIPGTNKPNANRSIGKNWNERWIEVAQRLCKLDDGLSTGLVGYLDMTNEHLQKRNEDRTKKLKALGNAIVPQVVYQIMMSLLEVRSK